MYIEFCGLPACGKSALIGGLLKAKPRHRFRAVYDGTRYRSEQGKKPEGQSKLWRTGLTGAARFAQSYPDTYVYLTDPRKFEGTSLVWPTLFLSNYYFSQHYWRKTNPIISDEGFLQYGIPASSGRDDADVIAYIDTLPPIDGVIVPEVEPSILLERLSARPRGLPYLLRDQTADQVDAYFAHSRRVMELMTKQLAEKGTRILTLNAGLPISDNVPEIEQFIADLTPDTA